MTDPRPTPRQHIEDGIDRMVTAPGVTTVIRNARDGKRYWLGMRSVGGAWVMRVVPVGWLGIPRRQTILWEGAVADDAVSSGLYAAMEQTVKTRAQREWSAALAGLISAPAPRASAGGLSVEDRARLATEGYSDDELRWTDAWLRGGPGRTVGYLKQEQDRFLLALRDYFDLIDKVSEAKTTGAELRAQLEAVLDTGAAVLAQIDPEVLMHGFTEIATSNKMKPGLQEAALGVINRARAMQRIRRSEQAPPS